MPDRWIRAALGDVIGSIEAGTSFKCEERPPRPGETGVMKVSAVTWGAYDEAESKTVLDLERIDESLLVQPDDFLFSRANTINLVGACVIVHATSRRLMLSDKILRIKFTNAEQAYVLHYLRSPAGRSEIEHLASGNQESMRNIGQDRIRAIRIPLPPLSEQRRIVAALEEHLSDLDAAVAGLERARANTDRFRAAVLREACTGRIGVGAVDASPIEETPNQYGRVSTTPDIAGLPHVPEGWTVASLDELMTRITSGSRDWSRYYGSGTGTFIMAQNVRPGRLDLTFRQAVNPPIDDRDRERSQVQQNDVLVTIVGANTGDVCLVSSELPEHYVCQSVALLRPRHPKLGPWIALYLSSPENGQRQFERYIYGAGRPHLSFDQLRMTAILVPPKDSIPGILAEVERRLAVADRTTAEIDVQLARAKRLRQAILKRAFEGELVPQDPRDEPASVLLDRIRASRTDRTPTKRRASRAGSHVRHPTTDYDD
jgi:type I restriction enzyme, S subunit